jgi:hypothetical protein
MIQSFKISIHSLPKLLLYSSCSELLSSLIFFVSFEHSSYFKIYKSISGVLIFISDKTNNNKIYNNFQFFK